MRSLSPARALFLLVSISCLLGGLEAPRGPGHERSGPRPRPTSSLALGVPEEMAMLPLPDSRLPTGGHRVSRPEIYVPVKRCHAILKDKVGEFSIPVIRSRFPRNIRCNWTIWAGPQSHVVVYIHHFLGNGDCEANSDKIVFQRVSSVAESSEVLACSRKRIHVYATQALAVHVVLLSKNYAPSSRYRRFKGKYFIFQNPRADSGGKIRKPQLRKLPILIQRTSSKVTISSAGLKTPLWAMSARDSLDEKWLSLGPYSHLLVTPRLQSQGPPMGYVEERLRISEPSVSYVVQPSSFILLTTTVADSILATMSLGTNEKDLRKTSFPIPAETAVIDSRLTESLDRSILSWPSASREGLSSTLTSITNSMVALELTVRSSPEEWQRPEGSSEGGLATRPTSVDTDLGSWKRTTSWKGESVCLCPCQVVGSISRGGKQQVTEPRFLPDETPTLHWEEPDTGPYGKSSMAAEAPSILGDRLSAVPATQLSDILCCSLPVPQAGSSPDNPLWGTVAVSEDIPTSTIKGLAWLSVTDETETLVAAYPRGKGSTHPTLSHGPQVVTSVAESHFLPWMTLSSPLPELETTILISSWYHESLTEIDPTQTAWSPEGLVTEPLESLTRVKPTTVAHQTPLATATYESVPQSTPVFLPSTYRRGPGTPEGLMGMSTLTSWLVSGFQLSSGTLSETRGEVRSTLSSLHLTTRQCLFSNQGKDSDPNFLQSSLVILAPSPSLAEIELTSKDLVNTSRPEFEEVVPSGAVADPQHLGLSENLLLITSYGRENTEAASLLEGRLDGALYPFPSKLIPGFSISHRGGSFPESESPSVTKAFATVAASLVPKLQTSWAMIAGKATEDHTEMIIRPSRVFTFKEAKPWQATHALAQMWKASVLDLPAAASSFSGTSLGNQTGVIGAPVTPFPLSAWEDRAFAVETEMPQNCLAVNASSRIIFTPVRRCHVVFKDTSGEFSLSQDLSSHLPNIWCNWTIWAGPEKHVVIYIQGFGGGEDCAESRDMIIFQGVSSSVEKVVHACRHSGTLMFTSRAAAVHVVLLSMRLTYSPTSSAFRGRFYVFPEPRGDSFMGPEAELPLSALASQRFLETTSSPSALYVGLGGKREAGEPPELKNGEAPSQEHLFPFCLLPNGEEDPLLMNDNVTALMQLRERGDGVRSLTSATTFWNSNLEQKPTLDGLVGGRLLPAPSAWPSWSFLSLTSITTLEETDGEMAQLGNRGTMGGSVYTPLESLESSSLQEDLLEMRIEHQPTQDPLPASSSWVEPSGLNGEGAEHQVVTGTVDHPSAGTVGDHTLIPTPEFHKDPVTRHRAKVLGLLSGILKNSTADGLLISAPDVTVFSSLPENGSILTLRHNPEDILVKVTVESEHLEEILGSNASEVLRLVMRETKQEVSEKKEDFSLQHKEARKTRMGKKDAINVTYIFWLHLRSQGMGVPGTLPCQLQILIKNALGTHEVEKRYPFFEDVNECEVGLGLCVDGAECVNSAGSYSCHCHQEEGDLDPTRPDVLCAHAPHTGVEMSFNSVSLLIGASVLTAVLLMLAVGLTWLVTRIYNKKTNPLGRSAASQAHLVGTPAFDLRNLSKPHHKPRQPSYMPGLQEVLQDDSSVWGELQVWTEQSERL